MSYIAELDGEYVGNASFDVAGGSRRNYHRADIGIALYLDYTGMGIGKKLFALFFLLGIVKHRTGDMCRSSPKKQVVLFPEDKKDEMGREKASGDVL